MAVDELQEFSEGEQDVAVGEFVEERVHGSAHLLFLLRDWLLAFLEERVSIYLFLRNFHFYRLFLYFLFSLF